MSLGQVPRDQRFTNLTVDNTLVVNGRIVTFEVSAVEINGNTNNNPSGNVSFTNLTVSGAITAGSIAASTIIATHSITTPVINITGTLTAPTIIATTLISAPIVNTGQIVLASASPSNEIVFENTSNGHTLTVTCAPTNSSVYTIPDINGNTKFLLADGTQTINGNQTFTGTVTFTNPPTFPILSLPSLALTNTANQLAFGTGTTTTIDAVPPGTSRVYILPDVGTNSSFVMTDGNQTINGTKTFTSTPIFPGGGSVFAAISVTNTTNQITLGAVTTVILTAPTPAAGRTYTIPDVGTNSIFVMCDGNQTINGVKTFTQAPVFPGISLGSITLTNTSNQITLGTTETITINGPTPGANRTYTLPDTGTNSSFVLTDGTQTINGSKVFSTTVTVTPTTNQLILGTTTLNAVSSSRTYTIPDTGGNSSFLMTDGTQTITASNTFTGENVFETTSTITIASTFGVRMMTMLELTNMPANPQITFTTDGVNNINLFVTSPVTTVDYSIPDVGTSSSFVMTDGDQTINGTKTFTTAPVFPGGGAVFAAITCTNTTNQITLGTGTTTTIDSVAPAFSRTYTIPDTGINSNFVMTEGNQTINAGFGITTFAGSLICAGTTTFNRTSFQLILGGVGGTKSVALTAPTPTTNGLTYTIADVGANSTFMMLDGNQTVNGTKTFTNGVPIAATTNQLVLGTTNTTTIDSVAPAASRTYIIPDAGTNSSFMMLDGAQTAPGAKTFSGGVLYATTGGTATNLNYYEQVLTTVTFSGACLTTSYTVSLAITRIGNVVTVVTGLFGPDSGSGSNSAISSTTAVIPSRFRFSINGDATQFAVGVGSGSQLGSHVTVIASFQAGTITVAPVNFGNIWNGGNTIACNATMSTWTIT